MFVLNKTKISKVWLSEETIKQIFLGDELIFSNKSHKKSFEIGGIKLRNLTCNLYIKNKDQTNIKLNENYLKYSIAKINLKTLIDIYNYKIDYPISKTFIENYNKFSIGRIKIK
ncbi:hypothetical protein NMZ80_12340 [Clostridioides difficile]|uniref:hypothetical protein n=1 Tax=Clostridioides difficile TaxID=1496 RepID=UPI0021C3C481|nr:hypothetical protein [Clostridioides difficile]UUC40655.1 hypothetical protein NMZ80_12340 [Clostridioides difficile]